MLVGQGDQGIGSHHLLDRVDQPVDDIGIQTDGDQMNEDLAIHRRLKQAAAPGQRLAQRVGVGEVAVMPDREPAEFEFRK